MRNPVDEILRAAIVDGTLAEVAAGLTQNAERPSDEVQCARSAYRSCERIGEICDEEQARLSELLRRVDIAVVSCQSGPRQFLSICLEIPRRQVGPTLETLLNDGYQLWRPIADASHGALSLARNRLVLGRTDDVTMRVELRWPGTRLSSSRWTPTAADLQTNNFPHWAWPLLFLGPIRRRIRRLGPRPRARTTKDPVSAPFLSTPVDLVAPLLDLLDLGPNDVLVDLGCGDGRIIVAAAEATGCRAIGVENNVERLVEAEARITSSRASDRVELIDGDLANTPIPPATAILLFMPKAALTKLMPRLLSELESGTRILAHELVDLLPLDPSETVPMFTEQSVTIAYLWTVP